MCVCVCGVVWCMCVLVVRVAPYPDERVENEPCPGFQCCCCVHRGRIVSLLCIVQLPCIVQLSCIDAVFCYCVITKAAVSRCFAHNSCSVPLQCPLQLPAPVAQWLARRTVGRKVWSSNPIRVMWDFSALAYPELGVLWAQWEGWNHTAELHPLHGCVFEGAALIT